MPNLIDEAAAKGASAIQAAAARMHGMSGVFRTLVKEHGEAEMLLKRAQATDDAEKQRELWRRIRVELLSHEKAELEAVYAELGRHEIMRETIRRHNDDAERLQAAITRVDTAEYGTEPWSDALKALVSSVEKHVEEEEREYLPLAMRVVNRDAAEEMDERFSAIKKSFVATLTGGQY